MVKTNRNKNWTYFLQKKGSGAPEVGTAGTPGIKFQLAKIS
jgi:hypothetical protein